MPAFSPTLIAFGNYIREFLFKKTLFIKSKKLRK